MYQLVSPPFTLDFRRMKADELSDYAAWFMGQRRHRIAQLESLVDSDPSYADWHATLSIESLAALGSWFPDHVVPRKRSWLERKKLTMVLGGIAAPESDLSIESFSIAFDVGIYFGEALLARHSQLQWEQDRTRKDSADFGQMLVSGGNSGPVNPIRVAINIAYSAVEGAEAKSELLEAFQIWDRLADGEKR